MLAIFLLFLFVYQTTGDKILKEENENFVLYCPKPNNETIITCLITTNNGRPLETKYPGIILEQGRIQTFGDENGCGVSIKKAKKSDMGIWTCLVAVGKVKGHVKSKDTDFDLEVLTAREIHREKTEGIERNTTTTLSLDQSKTFQEMKTKIIKREKERFKIHCLTVK